MAKKNSNISDNLPIDQSAGKSLFCNYVTIHFVLALNDVFDQANMIAASTVQLHVEKFIGDTHSQLINYYDQIRSDLGKLNEWQFIEPTPENLLAIEINKEINQRIYKGEDSENLSIVIDWFAKSPKQVVLPEVKEWSVNDYYAEANRTILLQLKDTTGAITDERKIVFRLESLSEILDVVSWENQLKYLKAKIVLLDSDGQKNEPKVEVNPTKKDGNKEDEKPEPSTFRVSKWTAKSEVLLGIFNKIKETEISDKPAIVTTEENLITVINENFVNEKGMPLMGHETGKSYDKIKVNCDIKAITEVFAYLSLASNHPNDKTLYYLRGRESSVKRIIANCFQHSFQEDTIRKYINDFYDSAESIGLNDHVNAIRKQRRKHNLISVVIDALSS